MTTVFAVDTETTGLEDSDEVIELAIVRWDDGARTTVYHEHYMPIGLCAVGAARVNGYTEAEGMKYPRFWYRDAEKILAILDQIEFWIGSFPTFDRDKLREMFRRTRTPWTMKRIRFLDTANLAFPLLALGQIGSTSLGALAEHYGLGKQTHTAIGDANMTLDVFERLLEGSLDGFARVA